MSDDKKSTDFKYHLSGAGQEEIDRRRNLIVEGKRRADIAQAGADQAKELAFFTNWSYAHPRSIELAARIAALAPGDLNRVIRAFGIDYDDLIGE